LGNILSDENEILSRWREYFEGLWNPVKAINDDTHEPICFGKEDVFTAREVAAAIGRIKSRKAAGEDEIRPEMLKLESIKQRRNSLTVSSCVKVWQNTKRMVDRHDHLIIKER